MKKYIMKKQKPQPPAAKPLLALIRRNIYLLSCRKRDQGIISPSFPGRDCNKDNQNCDSNVDDEYDTTMVKMSLTKSLSESSESVMLEEKEQEHSIANSSHEQVPYVLHIPDPHDLEIEARDDEHTEDKLEEDQWEWSMSGMSTIERDWKDTKSSSDFHNKTVEKLVNNPKEQLVHNLTKRANRSGLMIQREQSILRRHHNFPDTTTLPNPFLIRNGNSGITDELLCSEGDSQHDDNYDATADDDISIISPLTFTTAYTSASASTNASILDLKIKKRLLEQKIERRFQRSRCSTALPSSVEFVGNLHIPSCGRENAGLPYSSMEVLFP